MDTDSPDVPEKLKKELRNKQTSILKSLDLLDPKVFAPMSVNKTDDEDGDEDEMY